jgi:hypothetical protein
MPSKAQKSQCGSKAKEMNIRVLQLHNTLGTLLIIASLWAIASMQSQGLANHISILVSHLSSTCDSSCTDALMRFHLNAWLSPSVHKKMTARPFKGPRQGSRRLAFSTDPGFILRSTCTCFVTSEISFKRCLMAHLQSDCPKLAIAWSY